VPNSDKYVAERVLSPLLGNIFTKDLLRHEGQVQEIYIPVGSMVDNMAALIYDSKRSLLLLKQTHAPSHLTATKRRPASHSSGISEMHVV
jgi:hypothetical protein